MLCAERLQRLIQASILGFVLLFAALGIQDGERSMLQIAFLLQVAMMVMLVLAGLTGFCPGLKILKKIFPPCEQEETKEQ